MRRWSRTLVSIAFLACLALPATASADLPVGFTGPTWFVKPAPGDKWSYSFKGATVDVQPQPDYYDPDGGGQGTWTFSNPDDAAGTFVPNIVLWPQGQAGTYSGATTTYGGAGLLMVHRTSADAFTVFALDFAGGDALQGRYATCGPRAFVPNPRTGASASADVYAEGTIRIERGTTTPVAPPASAELYGYDGRNGGEDPLCDDARNAAALWTIGPGGGTQPNDRRATQTAVTCNRGPNPGDPFACTATVADADQRAGPSAPTGTVSLSAPSGSLNTSTCALTASTATSSICTFTYVNPDVGAGQAVPVTAKYNGSSVHKGASGANQTVVPPSPTPPVGTPPVVCGAAPLPSCSGLVPTVPAGQVCGATGTILPACNIPVVLPEVCGPSSGTLLRPCQATGPNTVACGGLGTILPVCNLPANSTVAGVCGATVGLQACTGENAPVVVCGSKSKSTVPACRFTTDIDAVVTDLKNGSKPGSLTVDLECPEQASPRDTPGKDKSTCPTSGSITLGDWLALQRQTLVRAAIPHATRIRRDSGFCLFVVEYDCQGPILTEEQAGISRAQAQSLAGANGDAFLTRAAAYADEFVSAWSRPNGVFGRDVEESLRNGAGPPRYRRPEKLYQNGIVASSAAQMGGIFEFASLQYRALLDRPKTKPKRRTAAPAAVKPAKAVVLTRSVRLRGSKRTRVRITLTAKDIRRLTAGRKITGKTLPVRLIVAFKAKPRPVVRVFDFRLPVRP